MDHLYTGVKCIYSGKVQFNLPLIKKIVNKLENTVKTSDRLKSHVIREAIAQFVID